MGFRRTRINCHNKHLMTIPLREILTFVSARPSGFPEAKPRGTLRVVEKKKNLLFHVGYTSLLKKRTNCAAMARNIICGMRDVAGHKFAAVSKRRTCPRVVLKFKFLVSILS